MLAASLEPLAYCGNVASLILFYRYYFGCSPEPAKLIPVSFSQGWCTCYSDRLHDFSVIIPRRYKDTYVNSFFPCTAKLWNSLLIECLPLIYVLSGFKSRINRHLLTSFFLNRFSLSCNLFCASFCVTLCLVVPVQPCME